MIYAYSYVMNGVGGTAAENPRLMVVIAGWCAERQLRQDRVSAQAPRETAAVGASQLSWEFIE
jgi:hypothetical protein